MGVIKYKTKQGITKTETYFLSENGFKVLSEDAKEPEAISWESVDSFLWWLYDLGFELKLNTPVGRKEKLHGLTRLKRPEGLRRQSLPYQLSRVLKACFPNISKFILDGTFKMEKIPSLIEVKEAVMKFCNSNEVFYIEQSDRALKPLR